MSHGFAPPRIRRPLAVTAVAALTAVLALVALLYVVVTWSVMLTDTWTFSLMADAMTGHGRDWSNFNRALAICNFVGPFIFGLLILAAALSPVHRAARAISGLLIIPAVVVLVTYFTVYIAAPHGWFGLPAWIYVLSLAFPALLTFGLIGMAVGHFFGWGYYRDRDRARQSPPAVYPPAPAGYPLPGPPQYPPPTFNPHGPRQ